MNKPYPPYKPDKPYRPTKPSETFESSKLAVRVTWGKNLDKFQEQVAAAKKKFPNAKFEFRGGGNLALYAVEEKQKSKSVYGKELKEYEALLEDYKAEMLDYRAYMTGYNERMAKYKQDLVDYERYCADIRIEKLKKEAAALGFIVKNC